LLTSHTDRTKDLKSDDKELEKAMIDAVATAKAWALRGSKELTASLKVPKLLSATKKAMEPLFDHKDYAENAKDVIGKSLHLRHAKRQVDMTCRRLTFHASSQRSLTNWRNMKALSVVVASWVFRDTTNLQPGLN
jgi:hypothetical protein